MQSLSTKIAIWMSIISVIIFTSISLLQYQHMKRSLSEEIEQGLELKSSSIADQVDAFFREQTALVQAMNTNQDIRNYLRTINSREEAHSNPHYINVQKTLDEIKGLNPAISLVFIASEKGNYNIGNDQYLTKPDYDIHTRPWYQLAVKSDTYAFTDAYIAKSTGKLVVTVVEAVREEGKLLGFVAIDIKLDAIPEIMNSHDLGDTGYAFLLGENGKLIYHPNEEYILAELGEVNVDLGKQQAKMLNLESGLETVQVDGEEMYIGYAPVSVAKWSVGGLIKSSEALTGLQSFTKMTLLYFLGGILALIGLVFIYLKKTLRVIPTMLGELEKVAEGDLTREIQLDRADEVGQLAVALNTMTQGLNNTAQVVSQSADQVSRSSEELDQIAQKTVQSTQEVTQVIQEIAKATEMQATTTEQGALQIQEMAERLEIMGGTIDHISDSTIKTAELSNTGMATIDELQHWFNANQQATEAIGVIIQEVEQSSQAISGIIDVINQITSQTNLLSLNASIEAARVGEAGSGFAIVAHEIRALSEQTAKATEGIHEKIAQIQSKAQEAVKVFTESQEAVVRNGEAVQETGKTFGHITQTVQELSVQVEQLAALGGEVEERKNHILDVIQQISASAEENSAATEEVSASAQEQLQQIEQVSVYARQLDEASNTLTDVMGHFKTKN